MRLIPLRNLVLVRFEQERPDSELITVIRDPKQIRPARVLATGPECRDVKVGMVALVNSIAGTSIGDSEQLLIPESAIVGTL